MLITAGEDGSRDSQGFLMNRERTTNSLNFYNPESTAGDENIGTLVKGFQNPFSGTQQNAMTITFWLKTPDVSGTEALLNTTVDNNHQVYIHRNGSRFRWSYESNTGGIPTNQRYKTVTGLVSADKWVFAAFALDHDIGDDTTRVKCYVGDEDTAVSLRSLDGTQSGTPTSGSDDNSMWIGGSKPGTVEHYNGQIDDICMYTKTLTLAEIKRNFNAGKRSHR